MVESCGRKADRWRPDFDWERRGDRSQLFRKIIDGDVSPLGYADVQRGDHLEILRRVVLEILAEDGLDGGRALLYGCYWGGFENPGSREGDDLLITPAVIVRQQRGHSVDHPLNAIPAFLIHLHRDGHLLDVFRQRTLPFAPGTQPQAQFEHFQRE